VHGGVTVARGRPARPVLLAHSPYRDAQLLAVRKRAI